MCSCVHVVPATQIINLRFLVFSEVGKEVLPNLIY